jgi:LAO/AO transport system kinase
MEQLTRSPHAFVRPSPTAGALGGVARRTREAMLLCEAAGFDVILVETVGVGQSEVDVAAMVDLFLVLVSPGGGDELQGLKRGIMELADLVVVNKADGELLATARATASDYAAALHLVRPRTRVWAPRVLTCSALTGSGVAEVWAAVGDCSAALADELPSLRAGQNRAWMWSEVTGSLLETLRADAAVAGLAERLEREVAAGVLTPAAAARAVVEAFLGPHRS